MTSAEETNPFGRKLAIVLGWSFVGFSGVGGLYWMGWLDGYLQLKQSLRSTTLFTPSVAVADMLTGAVIWALGDWVGQYLARHPARVDRRQTALVALFGLPGGLGTHVLLNAPDALLPVLTHTLANQLLRTAVVLAGGLALTLLFTSAQSKARQLFRLETFRLANERRKAADVLLVKLIAAPVKTFIVINVLPISGRVVTEQLWDYLFTMIAAYLMNRDEPLIFRPRSGRRLT